MVPGDEETVQETENSPATEEVKVEVVETADPGNPAAPEENPAPASEPEAPSAIAEVSANAPENPQPGDKWKDPHTGRTYQWSLFGDDIWGWSQI